jgi:hypothetical protein
MRSRFVLRALLLTSVMSVATGCRDATAPDSRRAELAANRQRWAASGLTNYSFTLRMECFCAINGPVIVTVVNDSVFRVQLSGSDSTINAPWMPTIKKLFDVIEQDFDRNAAVLQVTYHPTLGYPTKIVSDPIANAVDDEVTYTVTDVRSP